MKKYVMMLVAVMLFSLSAHAAEVKMGYVDLNKALNESEEGKKAVKVLEDLFKSKQTVIDEKFKEFNKLGEEIQKQSSILNQDALKAKQEERERVGRDLQRMKKDAEDEIEKKRSDFMDKIIKEIAEVVRKTGAEEGYTAIFEKVQSGLMYMPESQDLTEKIIKRYNELTTKK